MTQLAILLKKHWWVQKRRILGTLCEFIFPILVTLVAAFGVNEIQTAQNVDPHWMPHISNVVLQGNSYKTCNLTFGSNCSIGIVPSNISSITGLSIIIEDLQEHIAAAGIVTQWLFFDSNQDLSEYYFHNPNKLWAGIVFSENSFYLPFSADTNSSVLVHNLNYAIRMNSSYLPPVPTHSCDISNIGNLISNSLEDRYSSSGFLGLQNLVESAFINNRLNSTGNLERIFTNISTSAGPARFLSSFQCFMGLFAGLIISWGYIPLIIVPLTDMIREKNSRLKELMMLMGLKHSAYWWSWFIWLSIPNILVSICLAVICGPVIGILKHSSIICLFFVFLSFGLSIITFSFFLSSVVKSPSVGGALGFAWIYIFGNFAVYVSSSNTTIQYSVSLVSPAAFILAYEKILTLEFLHIGLKFDTLVMGETPTVGFILMMLIDSLLYSILGWYFQQLYPGDGVGQPFYFIFLRRYWCSPSPKSQHKNNNNNISINSSNNNTDNDNTEENTDREINIIDDDATPESPLLFDVALKLEKSSPKLDPNHFEAISRRIDPSEIGIEIKSLTKIYESESTDGNETCTRAVDNLEDTLYKGQIYALLGRNGAGKTTTISMLTGMTTVSWGDALISGCSITSNMDSVRKIIGLCPQDSILYDSLTVMEHLELFGELRGAKNLSEKISVALDEVQLTEKKDTVVKNLSGGMKRRLSLAIAFLGDPEVVFLDEPTSGLDPVSRRQVWDLLRKKKAGKTIILTTHYMEEADILGDRIAIMSNGRLKCCGSGTFLKHRFGTGYYLHFSRKKSSKRSDQEIVNFVSGVIPNVTIHHSTEEELTLLLAMDHVEKFPILFKAIEDAIKGDLRKLGIMYYGVSMTSLEDVFLSITKKDEEEIQRNSVATPTSSDTAATATFTHTTNNNILSTQPIIPSPISQLATLSLCIIRNDFRNWKVTLFLVLIPFILLILSSLNSKALSNGSNLENQPDMLKLINYDELLPFVIPWFPFRNSSTGNSTIFDDISARFNNLITFREFPTIDSLGEAVIGDYSGKMSHGGLGIFNFSTNLYNYTIFTNISDTKTSILIPNLVSNAILAHRERNLTNKSSLTVGVQPFPSDIHRLNSFLVDPTISHRQRTTSILVAICIGLSVLSGVLAERVVSIKEKKIKFLLDVSGVNNPTFYVSYAFSHMLWHFLSVIFLWLGFLAFSLSEYLGVNFVPVLLISVFFVFSQVTLNLAFSSLFSQGSSSLKFLIGMNILTAALPYIIIATLAFTASTNNSISVFTNYIPCFAPLSSFLAGLFELSVMYDDEATLAQIFSFDHENNLLPLRPVAMIIHILISILFLWLVESMKAIRDPGPRPTSDPGVDSNDLDTDVLRERLRIDQGPISRSSEFRVSDGMSLTSAPTPIPSGHVALEPPIEFQNSPLRQSRSPVPGSLNLIVSDEIASRRKSIHNKGFSSDEIEEALPPVDAKDAVRMVDLGKTYKNHKAVQGVSLGIKFGECFGLLGPNGAGKTTLINMLTGELQPSFGNAFLDDISITKPRSVLFRRISIGCCLQENALFPHLTVKEHLTLYYKLRNKQTNLLVDRVVWSIIHMLHLEHYAGRQACKLSGGNKRKLCVGLSIISNNRILFLDEPSTGMDPSSRRALWKIISEQTVKKGNAVVLTTHSMEESESVCDRIGIMVKGQLKCLGTPQHLKNRFGSAYRLVITVAHVQQLQTIHNFIVEKFPQAKVLEQFGNSVTFTLGTVASLAKAFQKLEETKTQLGIESYSLSQTSLEQLFMYFAREQESSSGNM